MDNITKPDWPTPLETVEVGNVIQSQQNILDKIDETENRLRDDQREIERRKQNGIVHNIEESECMRTKKKEISMILSR